MWSHLKMTKKTLIVRIISSTEMKIEASVQKCLSAACHSHNKNSTSGKERVTLSAHHFTNMALDSVPKYVTRKEGKKKLL